MSQCPENCVQYVIETLPDIFRRESQNPEAVLLQQRILATVATVRLDAFQMLRAIQKLLCLLWCLRRFLSSCRKKES
jgi:hypothetical protein